VAHDECSRVVWTPYARHRQLLVRRDRESDRAGHDGSACCNLPPTAVNHARMATDWTVVDARCCPFCWAVVMLGLQAT
jgi:hypothetical protein